MDEPSRGAGLTPFVARIVIRDNGGEADLILGACTKGQTVFKPGDVWEISEMLDELVLRRVGKSHIRESMAANEDEAPRNACWGHSVNDILARSHGGYLVLTEEEWADACRRGNDE